jgi:hypothetical protein
MVTLQRFFAIAATSVEGLTFLSPAVSDFEPRERFKVVRKSLKRQTDYIYNLIK